MRADASTKRYGDTGDANNACKSGSRPMPQRTLRRATIMPINDSVMSTPAPVRRSAMFCRLNEPLITWMSVSAEETYAFLCSPNGNRSAIPGGNIWRHA